jgi:hypothetical protein
MPELVQAVSAQSPVLIGPPRAPPSDTIVGDNRGQSGTIVEQVDYSRRCVDMPEAGSTWKSTSGLFGWIDAGKNEGSISQQAVSKFFKPRYPYKGPQFARCESSHIFGKSLHHSSP